MLAKVKVAQSYLTLCNPMDYTIHGILQARILEWIAFPFSRGIFPTQGLNWGLLHCWQILYQLNHKGSPRILEWVVYPFSSRSSLPRNRTGISCIAGRFFTNWAIWEIPLKTSWERQKKRGLLTKVRVDATLFPWIGRTEWHRMDVVAGVDAQKVSALLLQLCLTLCDPMDCSPWGSFVHGISQARILE